MNPDRQTNVQGTKENLPAVVNLPVSNAENILPLAPMPGLQIATTTTQ
jgi:hypothetical protein